MGGIDLGKVLDPLGLFQKEETPPPPPVPEIPEPAVMPDPDDKQKKIAARRRASQRTQRSGRLSTINTDDSANALG